MVEQFPEFTEIFSLRILIALKVNYLTQLYPKPFKVFTVKPIASIFMGAKP